MARVYTDYSQLCTTNFNMAYAFRAGTPIWAFRFPQQDTCPPQSRNSSNHDFVDAIHARETAFALGNVKSFPLSNQSCDNGKSDRAMSAFLSQAFTRMAAEQKRASSQMWPQMDKKDTQVMNVANMSVYPEFFRACDLMEKFYVTWGDAAYLTDREPLLPNITGAGEADWTLGLSNKTNTTNEVTPSLASTASKTSTAPSGATGSTGAGARTVLRADKLIHVLLVMCCVYTVWC